MHQETTIVDSGAIVKADIFWNWIIFRETGFSTASTAGLKGVQRSGASLGDHGYAIITIAQIFHLRLPISCTFSSDQILWLLFEPCNTLQ